MMLNIILFGPPGAGKGTQSERIIDKYHLTHIATGDLFRNHLDNGTELGKLAQQYMDKGNLVPDDIVIRMVELKIKEKTGTSGLIFDGFPRTVNQAKALDRHLDDIGNPISGMIVLVVDEEELKKRIMLRGKSSGRSDDQDEKKIDNRIQVYKDETLPVAEYYRQQNKLYQVKGKGTIEEIFQNICNVIDSLPR